MSYCCSQCGFTAQFESALSMHRQLHHEPGVDWEEKPKSTNFKSNTVPRPACLEKSFTNKENNGTKCMFRYTTYKISKELSNFSFLHIKNYTDIKMKDLFVVVVENTETPNKLKKYLSARTSATRLFDKLRARICRSKMIVHQEDGADVRFNDLSGQSECTSKALKVLGSSVSGVIESIQEQKETFACHLCSFDADRITVLDRHLLNDHKIGLENLLKLVMAKTKDGLSDENPSQIYGIRQPYYKTPDDIVEDGEFVIETVTPKIKILKHTASNTDLKWSDIPDIRYCKPISEEMEKNIDIPEDNELLAKMHTLNECMCKFVDSSNTLKKVLTKEFDPKLGRKHEPHFNLGLGDQDTPREWEKAHSEKLERNRKYPESRGEKIKYSSESFYF